MKSKSESKLTSLWFPLIWFLKHIVSQWRRQNLNEISLNWLFLLDEIESSWRLLLTSPASQMFQMSPVSLLEFSEEISTSQTVWFDQTSVIKSQRIQYFSPISTKIKCSELFSTLILQLCTLTVCQLFFHLVLFLF